MGNYNYCQNILAIKIIEMNNCGGFFFINAVLIRNHAMWTRNTGSCSVNIALTNNQLPNTSELMCSVNTFFRFMSHLYSYTIEVRAMLCEHIIHVHLTLPGVTYHRDQDRAMWTHYTSVHVHLTLPGITYHRGQDRALWKHYSCSFNTAWIHLP